VALRQEFLDYRCLAGSSCNEQSFRLLDKLHGNTEQRSMHKPAKEPNDLEKFFVERANAGDIEGLVALYEPDATLACGDNELVVGLSQIREFFLKFLASRPHFAPSVQAPALCSGDVALTSSRHSNGEVSAEIARRQPDGTWLWAVDQFSLRN
jgi:ketosteroid isomerase-like protein